MNLRAMNYSDWSPAAVGIGYTSEIGRARIR
jgi:hypothetical protein